MWAMTGRKSNTLSPAQPQIFLLLPSLQECLVERPGAMDSWLAQTLNTTATVFQQLGTHGGKAPPNSWAVVSCTATWNGAGPGDKSK